MMIDLCDNPQLAANELIAAREMAAALHGAFPGYVWGVHVDGGLATVRLMHVSGQWGYVIKLTDQYSASDFKRQVVQAGGEILERFCLKTGRADPNQVADMKYDCAGRAIGDYAK
jgi:hypothetical protein